MIEKIEDRGTLIMSRKIHQYIKSILDYAVAKGYAKTNAEPSVKGELKKKPPEKHHKFIPLDKLPEFFELAIRSFVGRDGNTYLVFLTSKAYHVFIETEAKAAAKQVGP